jgi:hypothetical protein
MLVGRVDIRSEAKALLPVHVMREPRPGAPAMGFHSFEADAVALDGYGIAVLARPEVLGAEIQAGGFADGPDVAEVRVGSVIGG